MKEIEDANELKPVEQIKVAASKDIVELMNHFGNMGFNAKRLSQACQIYDNMCKDPECVKFFALSGALVPAGLQNVIYDLINEGFIDVLVTTGANLTHDVAEALGDHHLQGFSSEDIKIDTRLHEEHLNRIFDVFMPNKIYENMEDWIHSFKIDDKLSVKETLWTLGAHLPKGGHSILQICSEKKIPIYCPAFTDSGLGMQLSFAYPSMNLNQFEDLQEMINRAWDTKVAGVFIAGGGVPKNFIFQAMQFSPNSAKYVVQITTDAQVSAGGLSSASLSEAISWGKIASKSETVQVHLDNTIALPIILAYLKQQKSTRNP
ncbi:MAG: deoxyhypusine synthase family protein [Promethearchaeota archaeon]